MTEQDGGTPDIAENDPIPGNPIMPPEARKDMDSSDSPSSAPTPPTPAPGQPPDPEKPDHTGPDQPPPKGTSAHTKGVEVILNLDLSRWEVRMDGEVVQHHRTQDAANHAGIALAHKNNVGYVLLDKNGKQTQRSK